MDYGERLKMLRNDRGLTQMEISKLLGMRRATYARYETNDNQANYDTLKAFANFFNVTVDYLLGRTDTISNDEGSTQRPISVPRAKIPLLGVIHPSLPLLDHNNWEDEIETYTNFKADFAIRMKSDSMIYAGLHPGDIAFCQVANSAQHGQIVAAGVEDGQWCANLNYYIEENGYSKLRPANPQYEDIIMGPNHHIIGHVVAIQKDPPPLQAYKDLLESKHIRDEKWIQVIEKAAQLGMDGDKIEKMITLFCHVAKQLK